MFLVYEECDDNKVELFKTRKRAEEFVKHLDRKGDWLKILEMKPHDDFKTAYRLIFFVQKWKVTCAFEPVTYLDSTPKNKLLPEIICSKDCFLIKVIVNQDKLTEKQEKLLEKANEIRTMPSHKDSARWVEIFKEFEFSYVHGYPQ